MGYKLIFLFIFAFATELLAQDQDRYIVTFKDQSQKKNLLTKHQLKALVELPSVSAVAVRLDGKQIEQLQNDPGVRAIEKDALRRPLSQKIPWGIPMVQADLLSDSEAQNTTVCIIDSGFSSGHEDLADNQVDGSSDPGSGEWYEDKCGHGTHVAGTIAALNNDVGVVGVLPSGQVGLHSVKVFSSSSCMWSYSSTLIAALEACQQNATGNLVVNMSLGGGAPVAAEAEAFQKAYEKGVLAIAAAGNDGNGSYSYPASYDSVVSVAAIDKEKKAASFSQHNDQVELAAPGVDVLSTVPNSGVHQLAVGDAIYQGKPMQNAATGSEITGPIVDGGLCDAQGSWQGALVLCQRGAISFYDKVMNVERSGGLGVMIYNNEPGDLNGSLGDGNSSQIPAIGLSEADGLNIQQDHLGDTGQLTNDFLEGVGGYDSLNGTSMASPHVAGVAALVWSHHPQRGNADIRAALNESAFDLGAVGRDTSFGFGLVQAKAAHDFLTDGTLPPAPEPVPGLQMSLQSDRASYDQTKGETQALIFVELRDEKNEAVTSEVSFVSTLDGSALELNFAQVGPGQFEALLDLTTLAAGPHHLAVNAEDARAVAASADLTLQVVREAVEPVPLVVGDILYSQRGKNLFIGVLVVGDVGQPLPGVMVDTDIVLDGSLILTGRAKTDLDGMATFRVHKAPAGCYVTQVTDLSRRGAVWDRDASFEQERPFCTR